MKNRIILTGLLFIGLSFLFNSCSKDDIEKDIDDPKVNVGGLKTMYVAPYPLGIADGSTRGIREIITRSFFQSLQTKITKLKHKKSINQCYLKKIQNETILI